MEDLAFILGGGCVGHIFLFLLKSFVGGVVVPFLQSNFGNAKGSIASRLQSLCASSFSPFVAFILFVVGGYIGVRFKHYFNSIFKRLFNGIDINNNSNNDNNYKNKDDDDSKISNINKRRKPVYDQNGNQQ
eukprot:m.336387 g.336387  ORF g.336387 m.336387 type:complete len:131 (+) comp17837_c0_seq1:103-495(+)